MLFRLTGAFDRGVLKAENAAYRATSRLRIRPLRRGNRRRLLGFRWGLQGVCAFLRRPQHLARHNSKNKRGRGGEKERGSHGDTNLGQRGLQSRTLFCRTLCGCKRQSQIVSCSQSRVEQAYHGKPNRAPTTRGGERIELPEEPAGKRNPHQRNQEENQETAQKRRAVEEPAEILHQWKILVVSAHERDTREDANVHRSVR